MFLLIVFAFLAGIVTILSPCILPVLPVVLSGSVGGGKARPWGIITGFVVSFVAFTLILSALLQALGVDPNVLRWVAAALVLAFGLVMVIPFLKDRFMAWASRLTSKSGTVKPGVQKGGFWSGVFLGTNLGLVWTPCVGPIMGSVISLAAQNRLDGQAVIIAFAYALGTAVPLFFIMQGGRALLNKFSFFTKNGGLIQKIFGGLMVLTGIAILAGWDRQFQTALLEAFPSYGEGLTALEKQDFIQSEIKKDAAVMRAEASLSLTEGKWFNSPPLTEASLKGKVVLVDFWTYSCINCIRTLPYLKAWYEKYKDKGLVIIGVHTPEFAFEKNPGNLEKAIKDLGVPYPVVQDNDFKVWNAFQNEYWPGHYFFDRQGQFRYSHFGEGNYEESEKRIQEMLGESEALVSASVEPTQPRDKDRTLETYLGYNRGRRFASPEAPAQDKTAAYTLPSTLGPHHWALSGSWLIGAESAESQEPGVLAFQFQASKVYLVLNPQGAREARVTVDGKPVDTPDVKNGRLILDKDRLYQVFDGATTQQGLLKIEFPAKVKAFAFTFG